MCARAVQSGGNVNLRVVQARIFSRKVGATGTHVVITVAIAVTPNKFLPNPGAWGLHLDTDGPPR